MCRYADAADAELPRSLRVLRLEGPLVDPADATVHAYGVLYGKTTHVDTTSCHKHRRQTKLYF
jgi:hypothetical protein